VYRVAFLQTAASQVDTFTTIGPGQTIIARVVELLILIATEACPDLKLNAVRVVAVGNVQAFVTVYLDGTAFESPFLSRTTIARLEQPSCQHEYQGIQQDCVDLQSDSSTIRISCSCHTPGGRESWFKKECA
jgi:hypothetical protein